MLACQYNQEEIVLYLLNCGLLSTTDLLCLADNGDTTLHCIAQSGSVTLARKVLLKAPTLHNKCNANDETPCDVCEENDHSALLEYFLSLHGTFGEECDEMKETVEERKRRREMERRDDQQKREQEENQVRNGKARLVDLALVIRTG
jgi:hypothetical protein